MNYNAWIFTIGNEIVHGRVLNTNASYLGRRLTLLGYSVIGNISLIDDVDIIAKFLKYVLTYSPMLIVTTGGLGPTHDDRTLEAVSKATGRDLELNMEALEMIQKKYQNLNLPLTSERKKMSYLPRGSIPIPNPIGTAPGCWLEVGNTIIISLPGVPREMEVMWESWIEPRLRAIGPSTYIVEKNVRSVGIPESSLAPIIKDILKKFPDVYIKTHPREGERSRYVIDIYIMYSNRSKEVAEKIVSEVITMLSNEIKNRYGIDIHTDS